MDVRQAQEAMIKGSISYHSNPDSHCGCVGCVNFTDNGKHQRGNDNCKGIFIK